MLKHKGELLRSRLRELHRTSYPVTSMSYKEKTGKELEGLSYKSIGRDAITNQKMTLKWIQSQSTTTRKSE